MNERFCQWEGVQTAPHQLEFPARRGEVSRVLAFVETATRVAGLPAARWAMLAMAVDEAFTNIVSYAYDECAEADAAAVVVIEIMTNSVPSMIGVRIHDSGTPFNPLEATGGANVSVPLMERRLGGLGIAMIRQLVDCVEYDNADGNTLTLWMRTPEDAQS
ncbi:MAG: ATP-binding protein [Thermoguttaceae bacterium]